jgi:hypothetical protein
MMVNLDGIWRRQSCSKQEDIVLDMMKTLVTTVALAGCNMQ